MMLKADETLPGMATAVPGSHATEGPARARPLVILGAWFIDWLIENGVIADGPIRRVIIDAVFDQAVHVYVEMNGTDDLIRGPLPEALLDLTMVRPVQAAEVLEVTGLGDATKSYIRVERRDDAAGA